MKKHSLSPAQIAYAKAKKAFNAAYSASRVYDDLMDAEGDRLGLEVPYCILPDGHPMLEQAQALLDVQNATRKEMYQSAHELFDWAANTVLAVKGNSDQKKAIRDAVLIIKEKAHVEAEFVQLVKISMQLTA